MSRRTADRPLTDAEERALIRLAARRDHSYGPYAKAARNSTTLYALADRGLVEVRRRYLSLDIEAKITDAGLALLATMGDS